MTYTPAPDLLQNHVILVTGAAGGIGRAAALAYARHGATVVLLGRTVNKLEKVYDEIVAAGGPQPAIFPVDLSAATDADFESIAQAIGYQLGRLDGILHCATEFENPAPLEQQNLEEWMRMFRVNAAAPAAINRSCATLLAGACASVILVGETHGRAPSAYWGGFAVSKAALEAYFKVQADEWSAAPMRINLFTPGPVHSPQRMKSHPGELKEALPTCEDLVPHLLYLMSADSREVCGQFVGPNSTIRDPAATAN
jgi:NAD(P)-dependent dehydrogenase (short-subunit alcohol dehydrogenase family)